MTYLNDGEVAELVDALL